MSEERSGDEWRQAPTVEVEPAAAPSTVTFLSHHDYAITGADNEGMVFLARISIVTLLMVASFSVAPRIGPMIFINGSVAEDVALATLGTWVILWIVRALAFRWRMRRAALPNPGFRTRLVCVGVPDRVLAHGDLFDRAFEPEFFIDPIFGEMTSGKRSVWVLLSMGAAAVILGNFVTGRSRSGLVIDITTLLSIAIMCVFWRTYFRISPGRLEVMTYIGFWRKPTVRRHDLTTEPVEVDLLMRAVRVGNHDYLIAFMPRRERFAYYLFLAAISTYKAPELPQDELLG